VVLTLTGILEGSWFCAQKAWTFWTWMYGLASRVGNMWEILYRLIIIIGLPVWRTRC